MKILTKLLLGFLTVAALCGIVGTVGMSAMARMTRSLREISGTTLETLDTLQAINVQLVAIQVAQRSIAHPYGLRDPAYLKTQQDAVAVARKVYGELIEKYEALPKIPEEQVRWNRIKDLIPSVRTYTDAVIGTAVEASGAGTGETGLEAEARLYRLISGEDRLIMDNFLIAVEELIDFNRAHYAGAVPRAAIASANRDIAVLLGVAVAAFLAAVVLGILMGRAIAGSLKRAVATLDRIAAGDTSLRYVATTKDEFAQVAVSLDSVSDTLESLIAEAGRLTKAAVEGRLETRGEAAKFQGGYRSIVQGVNETLDAVIGPLNVAAEYVDRISKGDIPAKITDSYNGDFNAIKNNLNTCIEAVGALVADAGMLTQAAVDGRLATRAEAEKHRGDFRRIVEGVNRTLDLVITPVNEVIGILKRMAEGDLTVSMTGDYKGDFDVLKTALNDTIGAMNEILGQVSMAVEQVTAGSNQVSQASQALSQGATEQASSLEEITSSVTEIAGQTRQNTENAVRVNVLAVEARENAGAGDRQMRELVTAMGDINRSAQEIGKIVKAIDDISFQINLLALNANVEAARAGKYGKGFAVVAEEVRNLAVRSAGSVKETTAMVEGAIGNIGRGNSLVEVTAKQLAAIVEGSSQVASLAEEVATAGREQSQGLEQITTGLNQIDQVTQSNTASAEESASAAEELSSQAQQLKGMVGRFKLKAMERTGSEEGMLAALRAELARREARSGYGNAPRALALHREEVAAKGPVKASAAGAKNAGAGAPKRLVNPADVINLDDDDFGKF